jgi:GNAT superfamily N-acetyltransferase
MTVINLRNNSIQIRDARPGELDQVSLLLKAAYQEYEDFIPSGAWQSYIEDIMDVRSRLEKADLIIAEMNRQLVGTVTLYLKVSRFSEEQWPKGWAGIRLLAVDPGHRELGIGRALMEECVRRCREHGIRKIGLHTTEVMKVARRMYEQMGFTRAPESDFHPATGVVVMAYRLDL